MSDLKESTEERAKKNFEKIFNNTLRKNIKSIQKEFDKMRSLANLLDEFGLEFESEQDKDQFFYILEQLERVERTFSSLDITINKESLAHHYKTKEDTKIYFKI